MPVTRELVENSHDDIPTGAFFRISSFRLSFIQIKRFVALRALLVSHGLNDGFCISVHHKDIAFRQYLVEFPVFRGSDYTCRIKNAAK